MTFPPELDERESLLLQKFTSPTLGLVVKKHVIVFALSWRIHIVLKMKAYFGTKVVKCAVCSRWLCFYLCPFVGLYAGLHKNCSMDFYEIWIEDGSQPRIKSINLGKTGISRIQNPLISQEIMPGS